LNIHILCKSIFSFSRHPSVFIVVQLPKITFIFNAIFRFFSNRAYRVFHFISPNLNQNNNMVKTFYHTYYNQLVQNTFYTLDISFFYLIFFPFVYYHNKGNALFQPLYQPLEFQILNCNYCKTKT